MNVPMDAQNNVVPAPFSFFAKVDELPALEIDCQNGLKHSGRFSTSKFLGSLTTKGRYRKATLAKAIL